MKIRIGLAQINTSVGDIKGNYEKVLKYIDYAKNKEIDILTFPELTLTGYPPEDLLLRRDFILLNQRYLKKIARVVKDMICIVGYVDGKKDLYNSAAVIVKGKIVDTYHKMALPNYGVFDEKRYFKEGIKNKVYLIDGIKIGVNICEDIWEKDGSFISQVKAGAKAIFNLSSSPYHLEKIKARSKLFKGLSKKNNVFIFYNNLVGGQDELVFDGGSMIFDEKGKTLLDAPQFEEGLFISDVTINPEKNILNKKSDNSIIKLDYKFNADKLTVIKAQSKKRISKYLEIYNALVLGVRDYVRKNGFKNVVIGLSGGIDSALTALVAKDALGEKNVFGVLMPSIYSSKSSITDSLTLSNNLKIKYFTIPINDLFQCYNKALSKVFFGLTEDTTEENIQARIRGNILMALSNKFGWLVLTTGNKSEISVGYCTLYGDMAGGFSVIKDVPKTLVYSVCEYINKEKGFDVIPKNILTKPPSAELRPNQLDEDSLPPYDVLDTLLNLYVERNKSIAEIVKVGYDISLVKRIVRLVDLSEYKRKQGAPGIKITPKAFGRDRRYPITNNFIA